METVNLVPFGKDFTELQMTGILMAILAFSYFSLNLVHAKPVKYMTN